MKKEVSKDYLKYMNNDGQCDKEDAELMKSKEKNITLNELRVGENNK